MTGARLVPTIIIPTRNTRDLTLAAVRAVYDDAADAHVVVVDDRSADGTSEAIRREFNSVELIATGENGGFSTAVNLGLKCCTTGLAILLNSDTEIRPGSIRAFQTAFAERSDLGIAGARLVFPDGRPQWSGGRFPTLLWLAVLASGTGWATHLLPHRTGPGPREVDWVTGAAMAIRREVLDEIGTLDVGYALYAQDLDLCRRAHHAGWQVDLVHDAVVVHHHGATIGRHEHASDSVRWDLMWTDLLRYVRKHDGRGRAERARRILIGAGRIRMVATVLRQPFVGGEHLAALQRRKRALRQAIDATIMLGS